QRCRPGALFHAAVDDRRNSRSSWARTPWLRRAGPTLTYASLLLFGRTLMTTSGQASPLRAKQSSLTVTAVQRANAVRNAGRYAWATAERDAAVHAAEPWLRLADEALWALVPSQELPRSIHVSSVYGTNETALCPNCKRGIIPFGNYPWRT